MTDRMKCSDCQGPSRHMTPTALRRGSQVREPGEGLCEGCSARRMLMVRAVNRLPNTLDQIKAMRAPAVGVS